MPSKYIQDRVIKLIEKYADHKKVKIVDVSASDGAILKQLHQKGFTDLTGTFFGEENEWEYKPEEGEFDSFKAIFNANILDRLPIENGSYDFVVNTELLEHLENHRHAIAELARIVIPGGYLILETPNISRMQSRLNFLLTGFHKPRTYFPPYHKPIEEHLFFHIFPVHLPVLDYFLYQYGLDLAEISWSRGKLVPLILSVIFLPFILLNMFSFFWKEKSLTRPFKWRLFKLNIHPATLLCNVLILTYRKTPVSDS